MNSLPLFFCVSCEQGADDLFMFIVRETKHGVRPAVPENRGLSAQVLKAKKTRGLQTYKSAQFPLYHLDMEPLTKQRQKCRITL